MIVLIALIAIFIISVILAYYFDYKRDPKYFKEGILSAAKRILFAIFIIKVTDDD